MRQFVVNAGKANAKLTSLGSALATTAAGAIAMAGGMAMVNASLDNVRAYADYEESLAFTQGLLGATREEMAAMEEQAFSLARTTRYTAGESMDAYYELLSAGLTQQEAMDALETTLKGAVIGHMEASESADMLTTAMRAFQIPAEDSLLIMDKLTMGTRLSKIHFDEYTHAFGTFGGVMAGANQSMEDSIALFGVMRTAGLSASRASMMIKMLGTHLMGMSDANIERVNDLGVAIFDSAGEMRALPDIMRDIFTAMPVPSELIGRTDLEEGDIQEYAQGRLKTFTDIFGMRAVAGLLNVYNAQLELNGQLYEGVDAVDALSAAIGGATGYTDDYYDLMSNTINEKVRIMQSTIDLIKVQLGQSLAESAAPLMDKVIEGLNYVSEFLQANPEVAKAIGMAVLIGGVLLTVAGAIVALAGLVGLISLAAPVIGGVLEVLGIIAAIVAVVTAASILVMTYWDKIKAVFVAVGEWLWGKFGNMLMAIGLLLMGVGILLYEGLIKPVWSFFKSVLLPVLLVIGGVSATIIGFILMGLDMIWGLFQTIHAALVALFTWDWDYFKAEFDRIWNTVFDEIAGLADFFVDEMWTAIAELASKLFSWNWSGGSGETFNAAGNLDTGPTATLATDVTASGFRTVTGATVSYASGTTQVPRDGYYYLHEGEPVGQRGDKTSNGFSIGQLNINAYGREEPEDFARRVYNELKACMSEEREATAHV